MMTQSSKHQRTTQSDKDQQHHVIINGRKLVVLGGMTDSDLSREDHISNH